MLQPISEKSRPSQSLASRGLLALPWLVGFGLCALPVFFGILNHDVAWLLFEAERVLAGQTLYVDLMEINPPLIVWLNFAPVLLARALGISTILSLRIIMLGLLAGSLLMARWALSRDYPDRPAARWPVLVLAIIALLPLAGYDFGQREHLMLILFLPYLLLASARAKGRALGVGMPWAVGLMAGVGLSLKPHFVLLWIAIEAYLAWTRRGWRVWLRPEAVAVAVVGLSYGIAILKFTPEYLSLLKWAAPVYTACVRASFSSLLSVPTTKITMVAVLGFLAIRPRGEHRECCRLLLIANLVLLGVAFLQDKGFSYHFYPALATAMMLIGLLSAGSPGSQGHLEKYSLLTMKGVLAVMVLNTGAACVGDSLLWRGCPDESDTTVGRMIRLVKGQAPAPSGSIFTFSPSAAASFPLATYGNVRWPSRHSCLWFLPALYPKGLQPDHAPAGQTTGTMGQTERYFFDSVVSDLLRERPTLLFVDETVNKPAFNGGHFDFLEYYSLDPRFADFLRDYERIANVDFFRVYRRKVSTVVQKATARDETPIRRSKPLSSLTGRPRRRSGGEDLLRRSRSPLAHSRSSRTPNLQAGRSGRGSYRGSASGVRPTHC